MLKSTVLAQNFPASPFMCTRTESIMEGDVSGNNGASIIDGKQEPCLHGTLTFQ